MLNNHLYVDNSQIHILSPNLSLISSPVYSAAYFISPLGCLIDISNLMCPKLSFWYPFPFLVLLVFPFPNEWYLHPSGPKSLSHLWCLFLTPNIWADPLGPLLNRTKDCLFLVSTTILFHLYDCINLLLSLPAPALAPLEFILITRDRVILLKLKPVMPFLWLNPPVFSFFTHFYMVFRALHNLSPLTFLLSYSVLPLANSPPDILAALLFL